MFNITFQQIEAFLAIARYLNLSKAGEALYTSQPALSKTLKRFEDAIGMRLFTRSNQGMALTSEGKALREVLEPLYKSIDKGIQSVQKNAHVAPKTLRIVAPTSFDESEGYQPVLQILAEYERRYPNVMLKVMLLDLQELRETLVFGNADIVFTEDFGIWDLKNVSAQCVSKFKLYLAMSANHPITKTNILDPEALSREIFYALALSEDPQVDINNMVQACSALGFTPKGVEFMPNFVTLLHAIKMGKGMSIVGKAKSLNGDNIKYYPLYTRLNPHIIGAWRTGHLSREAKNLISLFPIAKTGTDCDNPPDKMLDYLVRQADFSSAAESTDRIRPDSDNAERPDPDAPAS